MQDQMPIIVCADSVTRGLVRDHPSMNMKIGTLVPGYVLSGRFERENALSRIFVGYRAHGTKKRPRGAHNSQPGLLRSWLLLRGAF